jgi:hypothetical protein
MIFNIVIAPHDVHDNIAMGLLEILKAKCVSISTPFTPI